MKDFRNYKSETIGLPQFDKIRNDGRLLMEYVRGSSAYGTNIEGISDVDTGGVYICTINELLGYNIINVVSTRAQRVLNKKRRRGYDWQQKIGYIEFDY